jgi:peptidoglycan/LPS O-acetylase OafA/YrhL
MRLNDSPDRPIARLVGERERGQASYPLFDYLRMVLALGVFAAHADRSFLVPHVTGNLCVQVFFALSGFLIGSILLRTRVADLPHFYFNRVTRIWVPYVVAIVAVVACSPLVMSVWSAKFWEFVFYQVTWVYNWFGLPQNAAVYDSPMHGAAHVFWSICVEEQFYLVAPFVICVFPRWRPWMLAAIVALHFFHPHDFAAISLGELLAISVRRWGHWFERPVAKFALGGLCAAMLTLLWLDWDYNLLAPWFAVSVVALVAFRGRRNAAGVLLGGMSYPFYLNHWVGLSVRLKLSHALGLGLTGGTALALGIDLLISAAHFHFIDRVVLARRGRWYTRERGKVGFAVALGLVLVGVAGGLMMRGGA